MIPFLFGDFLDSKKATLGVPIHYERRYVAVELDSQEEGAIQHSYPERAYQYFCHKN